MTRNGRKKANARARQPNLPQRRQQRAPAQRSARAAAPRQQTLQGNVRVAAPPPRRDNNEDKLVAKLTGEDAALVNYMDSLTNWDGLPAKVPILLGEFELETDLYEIKYNVQAEANASGFAFVTFSPDNWYSETNDGVPAEQFVGPYGGTSGRAVNYSASTYVGTALPTFGVAYVAGQQVAVPPDLGPKVVADTRLRLTSAIMNVWSDAATDTAAGDVVVATIQNSYGMMTNLLNGKTYSQVEAMDEESVVTEAFPLSNWASGFRVHTHLTPWDEQCFGMEKLPAAGYTAATPCYAMVAVGSGMAAGQKFRAEIKVRYEVTRTSSHETTGIDAGVPFLEPARVIKPLRPLRGRPPTAGPQGHGNGKGINAAAIANPDILQPRPSSDFVDNLAKSAKKGLSWVASKIPYVGGLASKAVDWLFG